MKGKPSSLLNPMGLHWAQRSDWPAKDTQLVTGLGLEFESFYSTPSPRLNPPQKPTTQNPPENAPNMRISSRSHDFQRYGPGSCTLTGAPAVPTHTGQVENSGLHPRPRKPHQVGRGRGDRPGSGFFGEVTRRAAAPPRGRWRRWPGAQWVHGFECEPCVPGRGMTGVGPARSWKQTVFGLTTKVAAPGVQESQHRPSPHPNQRWGREGPARRRASCSRARSRLACADAQGSRSRPRSRAAE